MKIIQYSKIKFHTKGNSWQNVKENWSSKVEENVRNDNNTKTLCDLENQGIIGFQRN